VSEPTALATGQFGKNHQGDRDEHLPTMHGFDEFLGNLCHLIAEEEPENRDYPGDLKLANGKTFREQFGPRGVIESKALPNGKQGIKDTGPLTRKLWAPSIVVKASIGESWKAHIEPFGIFSEGLEDNRTPQYVSPGVHHLLTPDFEFGVRVG